jgi:hypothetical protein
MISTLLCDEIRVQYYPMVIIRLVKSVTKVTQDQQFHMMER